MSEAPYLAWLLTWEDTLRLLPLEGCLGEGLAWADLIPRHSSGRGGAGPMFLPALPWLRAALLVSPGTWLFPAEPLSSRKGLLTAEFASLRS